MKPVTDLSERPRSSINLAIWWEYWLWRGPGNPPAQPWGQGPRAAAAWLMLEFKTTPSWHRPPHLPPATVKRGKQERAVEGKQNKWQSLGQKPKCSWAHLLHGINPVGSGHVPGGRHCGLQLGGCEQSSSRTQHQLWTRLWNCAAWLTTRGAPWTRSSAQCIPCTSPTETSRTESDVTIATLTWQIVLGHYSQLSRCSWFLPWLTSSSCPACFGAITPSQISFPLCLSFSSLSGQIHPSFAIGPRPSFHQCHTGSTQYLDCTSARKTHTGIVWSKCKIAARPSWHCLNRDDRDITLAPRRGSCLIHFLPLTAQSLHHYQSYPTSYSWILKKPISN